MEDARTTVVVQRFLDDLAAAKGDSSAEPIVRKLLASAVDRLHLICTAMLFRSYPRLTRPPLNLQADEMLSAVVERLLKAMRDVHPQTVRQFFALANQHIRWELNDLARRLDKEVRLVELRESMVDAPPDASGSQLSPNTCRILEAIESLPEEEREAFDLVRIQGMSQPEAAEVLGISAKTVQRRLVRCLTILTEKIGDLRHAPDPNNPA
jgi:RNA polymerase sigma-70 factor (ECF subfamily)